jgi:alpha-1,3-rhamnosyl/mannosyltransferase
MACGTPVVAADNSSLPEVVGDAGLLVGATDVQALTRALERLVNDATLRQTLIARGLTRAMRFTWPKAAQDLLATYRRVGQA